MRHKDTSPLFFCPVDPLGFYDRAGPPWFFSQSQAQKKFRHDGSAPTKATLPAMLPSRPRAIAAGVLYPTNAWHDFTQHNYGFQNRGKKIV